MRAWIKDNSDDLSYAFFSVLFVGLFFFNSILNFAILFYYFFTGEAFIYGG